MPGHKKLIAAVVLVVTRWSQWQAQLCFVKKPGMY